MSAKDLNLSLDRKFAHDEPGVDGNSAGRRRLGPRRLKSATTTAPGGQKAAARKTRTASLARLWVPPALIAFVNMLFLVLAGIWLTGHRFTPMPNEVASAAAEVSQLQAQLDIMQEQLVSVQEALEEQQRLLLLQRIEAMQAVVPQTTPAQEQAESPQSAPATPTWQIHLGHFTSADEAAAVQLDLEKLGYTADITAANGPEDPGVSLLLGGFDERKLAELAAKDIMQRTSLNSLWVSSNE